MEEPSDGLGVFWHICWHSKYCGDNFWLLPAGSDEPWYLVNDFVYLSALRSTVLLLDIRADTRPQTRRRSFLHHMLRCLNQLGQCDCRGHLARSFRGRTYDWLDPCGYGSIYAYFIHVIGH